MKDTTKKWVDIWKKTSSSLQEIKFDELRANNYYQKNQFLLNEMLRYAFDRTTVRFGSDLIEQQQIFMKFQKKKINNDRE